MSKDYFLYSAKANRCVMIGSIGLGGSKSWPVEYGGRQFIRWAIEEHITDIILVDEDDLPEDTLNVSAYQPT